jgi:ParB-like chromosome segregation protein Spo0J
MPVKKKKKEKKNARLARLAMPVKRKKKNARLAMPVGPRVRRHRQPRWKESQTPPLQLPAAREGAQCHHQKRWIQFQAAPARAQGYQSRWMRLPLIPRCRT